MANALHLLGPQLTESKKKVQANNGIYKGILNGRVCSIDTEVGSLEFKVVEGIRGSCEVDVFIQNAKAAIFERYTEGSPKSYDNWQLLLAALLFLAIAAFHTCSK
jgi:hypothetical protein